MKTNTPQSPGTAANPIPGEAVSVMVVEDSHLVRERLAEMIRSTPHSALVGTAADGCHARALFNHYRPDAVILDMDLPDTNGMVLLGEFKQQHPTCIVMVLTTYNFQALEKRCATLGADHLFQKHTEFEQVKKVLRGMAYREGISPGIHMSGNSSE